MQRRATKQSPGPTAAEKRFAGDVKAAACIVCGSPGPSIVDHIWGSSKKLYLDGIERVSVGHWAILPLCSICDSVKTHGSRKAFEEQFGSQIELWFMLLNRDCLIDRVPEKVREAMAGESLPW